MNFSGELALKFALQSATHYKLPELVRLAQRAHEAGFTQLWVNDNLGQRNIFVVLAALAGRIPLKLGTAIVVPYFRNPLDIAGSLAALSELAGGSELSVGIARGEAARAGQQIEMPKPLAMVREAASAIKALLAGETIAFRNYPALASYHHIYPDRQFRLAFSAATPVRFYCGGHGPRILKVAGESMDGIYFGDHLIPVARAAHLPGFLETARSAAAARGRTLFDIGELDLSIARDRRRAIDFARPYAAHVLLHLEQMGFGPDDFREIGVEPQLITDLKDAASGGAAPQTIAALLSDKDVKTCFIAGDAHECREQLAGLLKEVEPLRFGQLAFAKLGPDYEQAITLLKELCDL